MPSRRTNPRARTSRARSGELWDRRPPTYDRTGDLKKKGQADQAADTNEKPEARWAGIDVATKYEALRRAVLEEGLCAESRCGLALLLQRGLWGWALAAASLGPPLSSAQDGAAQVSVLESDAKPEEQALVQLLAALAVASTRTRGYERIAQGSTASP